ncbi:hypothetical protein D3C80_1647740 [compost metagenome]
MLGDETTRIRLVVCNSVTKTAQQLDCRLRQLLAAGSTETITNDEIRPPANIAGARAARH